MNLDVYAIQTVPPSNVNRDDTGAPKTALYGGALRSRWSSQSVKRAMRLMFADLLPAGSLGVRTKLAVGLIAERVAELDSSLEERAEGLAKALVEAAGFKVKESARAGKTKGVASTDYLLFLAGNELEKLAELGVAWAPEGIDGKPSSPVKTKLKSEVQAAFHDVRSIDIALFGRMLADAAEFNVDASAQVAHAISVDRIVQEYDYFTAMDDCVPDDNSGAAMIDTVGFNSSTLYRYATVNLDSFFGQIKDVDAVVKGTGAFVEAFVRAMPSGKQNTFANRTLPEAVVVAFRETQSINVVDAFEDPIRPRDGVSISSQAIARLGGRLSETEEAYDLPAEKKWCVVVKMPQEGIDGLGERVGLKDLVVNVELATKSYLEAKA